MRCKAFICLAVLVKCGVEPHRRGCFYGLLQAVISRLNRQLHRLRVFPRCQMSFHQSALLVFPSFRDARLKNDYFYGFPLYPFFFTTGLLVRSGNSRIRKTLNHLLQSLFLFIGRQEIIVQKQRDCGYLCRVFRTHDQECDA